MKSIKQSDMFCLSDSIMNNRQITYNYSSDDDFHPQKHIESFKKMQPNIEENMSKIVNDMDRIQNNIVNEKNNNGLAYF